MKQRKELGLPPFTHLCAVKLRGKDRDKVRKAGEDVYGLLKSRNKNKTIKILAENPALRPKLRGNFYWEILLKGPSAYKISGFLKKHLLASRHSGIIVTVDMDPV